MSVEQEVGSTAMNQSAMMRIAQERLRRQANETLRKSRAGSPNSRVSCSYRRTVATSSYEYFNRAITNGDASHVRTWLMKNLPVSPVALSIAEPQCQRLQRTLREGLCRATEKGHDEVVRVLLEHEHPQVRIQP